jgi:hypothetical protein
MNRRRNRIKCNSHTICSKCNVFVHNLRKHLARDRCKRQHIRIEDRK